MINNKLFTPKIFFNTSVSLLLPLIYTRTPSILVRCDAEPARSGGEAEEELHSSKLPFTIGTWRHSTMYTSTVNNHHIHNLSPQDL